MQQAARVSDWTAFFYEGKLIEFGATQQLFTKPASQQTQDYITGRLGAGEFFVLVLLLVLTVFFEDDDGNDDDLGDRPWPYTSCANSTT